MDDTELLHKAINAARNFENFQDVLIAVSLHPEWLTIIPDGRKWAILHQIILSGNVYHLEQLLALQKFNKQFRLLTDTGDKQTVLDIASLRQDAPDMKQRIQQLIKLDEMLNYAIQCKWDQCYNIVKDNPSFVNEKPPYRRYYLIHHMACANTIEQFERFKQIKDCKFDLNLRADRKKINVIAREEKQPKFAAYIEQQCPSLLDQDDSDENDIYQPSEAAVKHTQAINTMMEQRNTIKDLDCNLMGKSGKPKNRDEVMQQINALQTQHEIKQEATNHVTVKAEEDKRKDIVLNNLMCPLTLAVFIEPVVAADGFTYERSVITKWLEKNDRSPMTNQPLPNKDLSPNHVVKQIINALQIKC